MKVWPLLAVAACLAAPARAVIILDSTWAEEGGTQQHPALGFGAHIALAHQPQFAAAIAFSSDGDTWGDCSGVWIGNEGGSAFVLTAAHCIAGYPASVYAYRTEGGIVLTGAEVFVHPDWFDDNDRRTGFDLAIIRLNGIVTDGGPQPALYDGTDEAGRMLTFAGFGSRGIGSVGQDDTYYAPANDFEQKAAGQGRIDEVAPVGAMLWGDAGNYLGIYLPREDGSAENPWSGETKPVSRLAGLVGSGDSGGPAFIQLKDGRWAIAGIASNGSGTARYGEASWFVRLSHHEAWIRSILPNARFAHD